MKLTAIKTVYLDGPKGENGKPTQIVVRAGDDFDTTAEIGERLLARGKAGKRGTVEIDAATGQPIEADTAAAAAAAASKPASTKK